MGRHRRTGNAPRHHRKPPKVCLIRIARGSARLGSVGQKDSCGRAVVGYVGQLDGSGKIISSNIATFDVDPSEYWRWLRSRLPADAIVTCAPIPGYINAELADVEGGVFRRLRADGRTSEPSAAGRRAVAIARAKDSIARRAARLAQPQKPIASKLRWSHGAKHAQTHALRISRTASGGHRSGKTRIARQSGQTGSPQGSESFSLSLAYHQPSGSTSVASTVFWQHLHSSFNPMILPYQG